MSIDLKSISLYFSPQDRVLCAVSGGADSVCLLAVLHEISQKMGFVLIAAHFNHCLRGTESDGDENFVRSLCERLKVPCLTGRGDIRNYAMKHSLSLETAARELRYEFLSIVAEENQCNRIATAHNLSDQAETVLFHLVRGTGSRGLVGIPRKRGCFVRPFLDVSREEILSYLSEHGFTYREDSSNAQDNCSRNLIRHHVLPVLEQINSSCDRNISQLSRLIERDEEYLAAETEKFLQSSYDGSSVSAGALASAPFAISSRALRCLLGKNTEYRHIEAILKLCLETERKQLDLPDGIILIEKGRLWLNPNPVGPWPRLRLILGETVSVPALNCSICCFRTEEEKKIKRTVNGLFKTFCLNCDEIHGDIVVTPPAPGDKFRPAGRKCTKSLKQLFLEQKFCTVQKEKTMVFRDELGILAVWPFGIDERALPRQGSMCLQIEIKEGEQNEG